MATLLDWASPFGSSSVHSKGVTPSPAIKGTAHSPALSVQVCAPPPTLLWALLRT